MAPSQPYIYDPPQRWSATSDNIYGFDPKAVTRASRMPPKKAPAKTDGPLVDFNRHPDSYIVPPYGQTNVKPMSPRTKVTVKWVRWVQLGLRISQLIGAIGMLICVICIKGTQATQGWILRIPPGLDILCSLYAIYHLIRPAKARSPGSSASYHFFAVFTDTGLIPFYVFAAMMANSNWHEAPGTDGRWRTFFSTDDATNKLLLSTWLTAVVTGGFHLFSVGVGLYLVLVFRKICRLPPDMNPLEDNLTSRRKHKHKASDLSDICAPPEKRFSDMSASTYSLSSPSRMSYAKDPLIPDVRTIPFAHSRHNSDDTYNPHNPRSARHSQVYEQSRSARSSRTNMHSRSGSMSPTKLDMKNLPVLSTKDLGGYDSMSPMSSPERSPVRSARSVKRESLKSDNWFVHPEMETEPEEPYHQPIARRYSFEVNDDGAHQPLQSYRDGDDADDDNDRGGDSSDDNRLRPQPLRMNPPTPTPPMPFQSGIGSVSSDHSSNIGRALTINSSVTHTTTNWGYFGHNNNANHSSANSNYSDSNVGTNTNFSSPSRSPTRKSLYYGDLRAATEGIAGRYSANASTRNSPAPPQVPAHQQQRQQDEGYGGFLSASRWSGSGGGGGGGTKKQMGRSPQRAGYGRVELSPRVVSASGVDVEVLDVRDDADYFNYNDARGCHDGQDESRYGDLGLGAPGTAGGRRNVSGKVAEEGLAGRWGASGLVQRKVSGVNA